MDYNTFEKLCLIYSPSGHESKIISFIKNLKLKNFIFESNQHSCIYKSNTNKLNTILIDTHIDTIHFKVIRSNKFNNIVVKPVGFNSEIGFSREVIHLNSNLNGLVISPLQHFQKYQNKNDKTNNKNNFINFGLNNKTKNKILPGDTIVFKSNFRNINKDYFIGSGFDNKAGVFIMLSILNYFDKNINNLNCNLIVFFSSNEEINLTNFSLIKNLKINEIIILDTDFTTDNSYSDTNLINNLGEINLNQGVVIGKHFNDLLFNKLINISKKKKIKYQLSFFNEGSESTNNSFYSRNFNSSTQFIGIPIQNLHTPNELISKNDLNNSFKLIKNYLKK